MINPLDYWPSDPNGFMRHLIAGAIMVLLLIRLNATKSFIIILFVALSKELADAIWLDSFWSWMDIVFTISPFVFLKINSVMKNKLLVVIALFLMVISGCKENAQPNIGQEICVEQDSHKFKPSPINSDREVMEYEWYFDNSSQYDLGNENQCDWNKLTGVSFNWATNHKNSLMASWRWDLDGYWLIAPYYHFEGNTYWANVSCSNSNFLQVDEDLQSIRVYPSQQFKTLQYSSTGYSNIWITNTATSEVIFYEHSFGDEEPRREINAWFGGDETAPHDMCINRKTLK